MKKTGLRKMLIGCIAACAMFSMTVCAEEGDDLTLISSTPVVLEEEMVEANSVKHGKIEPYPTMYDYVGSNHEKIPLKFTVTSFGDPLDYYEILVYYGSTPSPANLKARKQGTFSETVGIVEEIWEWDTTDVSKYPAGDYIVVCTSYYNDSAKGETINETETITITLEDYRKVLDRKFVERLYEKVFRRTADADGLEDWTNGLYNGTKTGADTVWGFFGSAEFDALETTDSEYVELLYLAIFDRASDADGKKNWMDKLASGMSRKYVLKNFLASQEFTNLCSQYEIVQGAISTTENRDRNEQVTGFVNRLYSIALNRTADVAGLNDWTGKLLDKVKTPKEVASGFVFSAEMTSRKLSNEEFVKMLYRTMMDREADESGLTDWVNQLNSGVSRQTIFNGFADSAEFSIIVKSYGL